MLSYHYFNYSFEAKLQNEKETIFQLVSKEFEPVFEFTAGLIQQDSKLFFRIKLLAVFGISQLSCITTDSNYVIFVDLKLANSSNLFSKKLNTYIALSRYRYIALPSNIKEVNVEISLLPFKPIISAKNPLAASCINCLLPLSSHITSCLSSFYLTNLILSSQSDEEFDFSKLNKIQLPELGLDARNKLITGIFTTFCEEHGFQYNILYYFPEYQLLDENQELATVQLYLPTNESQDSVIEYTIADKRRYCSFISAIFEDKGDIYALLNTCIGCFEISKYGIRQKDYISINFKNGQRYIALIYAKSSMQEFLSNNMIWPHPIVKNPKKYMLGADHSLHEVSELDSSKKYFCFNYNKESFPFPSVPSRNARSESCIMMEVQPRGQLVWMLRNNDAIFALYFLDKKDGYKTEEIIKRFSDEFGDLYNCVLAKVQGKCITDYIEPGAVINLPEDSLVVIEKRKSIIPSVFNKEENPKPVLVSYARKLAVHNTSEKTSIALQYDVLSYSTWNPRAYDSLKDALKDCGFNVDGNVVSEANTHYIFMSKFGIKKKSYMLNDFYNNRKQVFINLLLVEK